MYKRNYLAVAVSIALFSPLAVFASDTGDAPADYGLATHEVVANSPQIGEQAPDDNMAINTADAQGDDTDAAPDDEDGISAFPVLVQNAKSYSVNVFVSNPSSQAATLVGWVDFDGSQAFEPDEAIVMPVAAGAGAGPDGPEKVKLIWPDNFALSTDYFGDTYGRFRISTDALTANDASGAASDGEVEDYLIEIVEDSDGDEIPNTEDLDNDNDGIPDLVEGLTADLDNDGLPNYLDVDSDGDTVPDFAEAGPDANNPQDSDGDGQPDYLDIDSNNDNVADSAGDASDSDGDGISDAIEGNQDSDGDGIVNSLDIDSDNDVIPDAVELGLTAPTPVDTDGDLIPDYLDLDSDNDGIPDIYESNTNEINIDEALDADTDGRVDSSLVFGANGYVDDIETQTDSGVPIFAIPDSDGDGVRDFRDLDSDEDGTADVLESGGTDADNNGLVDAIVDANRNDIPDTYDFLLTGGADTDSDGIDDSVDLDFVMGADVDNDGILDTVDLDINADGIVDSVIADQTNDLFLLGQLPDVDGDFMPDFRDDDSIGATGDTNAGDTTDGGTTAGTTGGTTATNTTAGVAQVGMIETGLSGSGCSTVGRIGKDPVFPGLLLLGAVVIFVRRKPTDCPVKR